MTDEHPSLTQAEIRRIADRIDRPLVLVGLMGVGKSTIGRRLAGVIHRDFVDADEEIERAAQRSVREIFDEFGEPYFRDGERRVIARLIEDGHGVIATGGGAFVDDETRALILDKGIAIWLDCDIDILVERTAKRDTRPLLRQGDPRTILAELYELRKPCYSQAHIRVESLNGPHIRIVDAILEAVDQWL
ncbi:MAG: shikimate kinase [Erythrobacter sp. RIFCSPHIGHO2_12_FULL_63_10]|nr:MAG: shikimate kinase [Erythrobacter sp. RIFCSPHIGHO2_12_FULL_63_10]